MFDFVNYKGFNIRTVITNRRASIRGIQVAFVNPDISRKLSQVYVHFNCSSDRIFSGGFQWTADGCENFPPSLSKLLPSERNLPSLSGRCSGTGQNTDPLCKPVLSQQSPRELASDATRFNAAKYADLCYRRELSGLYFFTSIQQTCIRNSYGVISGGEVLQLCLKNMRC